MNIFELLDRFFLVVIGCLIGIVVIFDVWSKMPKRAFRPKRKFRRIERKQLKLILSLAGLILIWGSLGLEHFLGIRFFIPVLIGFSCMILHWVL